MEHKTLKGAKLLQTANANTRNAAQSRVFVFLKNYKPNNMNNEQLQAAKDQAAREIGYPNFEVAATFSASHVLINRAMEIYAEGVGAKWIPLVLEGNDPPVGTAVLIYLSKSNFITVGYKKSLTDGGKAWQMFGDTDAIVYADDYVSHWMPLPTLPTKNNTQFKTTKP